MPSHTAAIWAGVTGAAVVVVGAAAAYWAQPDFLWPNAVPVAATEHAPEAAAPRVAIAPAAPAAPAAKEPSPAPAAPPAVSVTAVVPAAMPAAAPTAPADPHKPTFDVVSVEPSGEAVVAGRARPNVKVELKDAGKTVAEATANDEGQFVMIPPPLPPGEHSLALSTGGPSAETSNAIAVAVAAPEPPNGAAAPSSPPIAPLSAALAVPPAPGAASRVAVQSIDASPGGRLVAKGVADPNGAVRLYLGGAYVGDAKTGADGRWSLTIKQGMTSGAFVLRADELDPADAKVAARAEAPFDYRATAADGAPAGPLPSASPADVVIDSIQTHHVGSGNTLWGISQKFYGDGSRYQIIFAANSGQIRNPNLIYPGQLFVVPKPEPKP